MKEVQKMLNNIKDGFIDSKYSIQGANEFYTLERTKNDVNGNPLYRLYLEAGTPFKHSQRAYRNYSSKRYYLLQSYDIKNSLERLFDDLDITITYVQSL